MKQKTMQELNEQYKDCPQRDREYTVHGKKMIVVSHFIGDKDLDEERQGESLSIENQRRVLTNYVNEQGWSIYDEYVDDRISGVSLVSGSIIPFSRLLCKISSQVP